MGYSRSYNGRRNYSDSQKAAHTRVTEHPTGATVTVEQARTRLKLFDDDVFDEELEGYIEAASAFTGTRLGVALSDQTREDYFDSWYTAFELSSEYVLDSPSPMVQYYNSDNVLTTVSSSNYIVDRTGDSARISFTTSQGGSLSREYINPIVVTYNSNNSSLNDNPQVQQAILLFVEDLFQNPDEDARIPSVRAQVSADRLLNPLKRKRL